VVRWLFFWVWSWLAVSPEHVRFGQRFLGEQFVFEGHGRRIGRRVCGVGGEERRRHGIFKAQRQFHVDRTLEEVPYRPVRDGDAVVVLKVLSNGQPCLPLPSHGTDRVEVRPKNTGPRRRVIFGRYLWGFWRFCLLFHGDLPREVCTGMQERQSQCFPWCITVHTK
jgi:hypothetical protein